MAKLELFLICERALVDATTNNLSIVNILEEVQTQPPKLPPDAIAAGRQPLVALQLTILSVWNRSGHAAREQARARIQIKSPKGKKLGEASVALDFSKFERIRAMLPLPGLPLDGAGRYIFSADLGFGSRWRRVGTVALKVTYHDDPAKAQALLLERVREGQRGLRSAEKASAPSVSKRTKH
jgi:hypothetical protein